ncbi:MAG: carbohydrate-binding protein [Muribaculaceae bacterium]|nr:carbohydrate-binding protein [Muribaculaceae bacterium]
MKKTFILIAVVLVALSVLAQPARSHKRGVSENSFTYPAEIHALSPGVSWFYNWGATPNRQVADVVGPGTEMEYVPMTWSANFNEQSLRTYLTEHPGVRFLLGYNEPNFSAQANMTPDSAARLWPVVEQIARDHNLLLVAPALNYSGETLADGRVYQPEEWMDAFLAAYPEAHFDFLALHCYMNDHKAQRTFVENFAKKYGKQVWLTEFCAWEGNVDSTYQKRQMVRKIQDLELSPYVYRYAWFKARGTATSPYYRLIIPPNVRTGLPAPGTLSDAGIIYTYMSAFDTTYYYTPGEMIAAKDFIFSSDGVDVEVSTDTDSPQRLQVGKFDVYAQVDYLVNIPAKGNYTLELRLASRKFIYDPKIRVEIDGTSVTEQVLPSTGTDDNTWATQQLTHLALPAGRHTLTLKSRQSTTCKLGWLRLVPEDAVTGDLNGDGIVDVDDLNIVINIIIKKDQESGNESQADLNGDGMVDVDDLNHIINIIIGKA